MKLIALFLLTFLLSGCKVDGLNAKQWQAESLEWRERHKETDERYWRLIDCIEGSVATLSAETVKQFKYNLRYCY